MSLGEQVASSAHVPVLEEAAEALVEVEDVLVEELTPGDETVLEADPGVVHSHADVLGPGRPTGLAAALALGYADVALKERLHLYSHHLVEHAFLNLIHVERVVDEVDLEHGLILASHGHDGEDAGEAGEAGLLVKGEFAIRKVGLGAIHDWY